MIKFFTGLLLGVGIAYLAYRAHALNRSGTIAAGVLGTIVFGLGGVGWAVVLLTFFISSSGLSKLFSKMKYEVDQNYAKGSRRDAGQVAANGAVAGLLVLAFFLFSRFAPGSSWLRLFWIGFAASLAGANADTWGTELGVLNPGQPLLLTTFKRVPKGTSGGVSLVGSLAAFAGAGLVGGAAVLVSFLRWVPAAQNPLWIQFAIITVAGFLGAMVDSFLGATFQGIYFCPQCGKETEHYPRHSCGAPTSLKRGSKWLNNDGVNFACTFTAGILGMLLNLILY